MDALRSWLIKYAKKKLMGVLIVKIPFLFSGPFGFFGKFLLDKFVVLFVDKVILGMQDLATDLRVDREVQKAQELILYFREAEDLTEEERKELDDAYAEAVYDLIELR